MDLDDPYTVTYNGIYAVCDRADRYVDIIEHSTCYGGSAWTMQHYASSPLISDISSIGNMIRYHAEVGTAKLELEASVAWKQGFMYKLIYPPYGKKNIINTREPIKGVKYHTGPESAYRSLTQIKKGELPPVIKRDMGIMDIEITRGGTSLSGKKGKPKMTFRQDKKQATKTTPTVSGVR